MTTKTKLMLKATAELSEAVAAHILGLRDHNQKFRTEKYEPPKLFLVDDPISVYERLDFNIIDPRHWMMVVEAMRANGAPFEFRWAARRGQYCCRFDYAIKAYSAEPGIAISLAALRANGVDCEWEGEGE